MGKTKGLVSVIIPAYNAERYIKEAINSVLEQTYPEFEIIVVDDASTDRTAEIVRSLGDRRIRLIQHETNMGPGGARNTAIEVARGHWIAILDADDQRTPYRLERMLDVATAAGENYFVADDLLLCFETPSGLRVWGNELELQYRIKFDSEFMDLNLAEYLQLGSPGIKPIIPMTHITQFSLRYHPMCFFGEDLEFVCHLFRTGLKLRLVREALYRYRLAPESLTSKSNRFEQLRKVYERLLAQPDFTEGERLLLAKQLNRIRYEERYAPFATALKRREFSQIVRLAVADPLLPLEFIRRLPRSLRYRVAAWRLRGNAR